MKIKRLEISGFRGIAKTKVLNFEKNIIALWGNNGLGKTSSIEAFKFLFTGNMPKNAINISADCASVEAVLDDNCRIRRIVTRTEAGGQSQSAQINGDDVSVSKLNSFISEKAKVPLDNIKAITSSDLISSMSKELGDFFLAYINDSVNKEDAVKWICEAECENDKISQGGIEWALSDAPDSFSWNDVAITYKELTTKRKVYKQNVKQKEALLASIKFPVSNPEEYDYDSIRANLDTVIARIAEEDAMLKQLKVWENIETKHKNAHDKIETIKKELKTIHVEDLSGLNLSTLKNNKAMTEEALSKVVSEISKLKADKDWYLKTIDSLTSGGCPLSSGIATISCKTDMTDVVAELKSKVNDIDGLLESTQLKEKGVRQSIKDIDEKIEKVNTNALKQQRTKLLNDQISSILESLPERIEKPVVSGKDYKTEKLSIEKDLKIAEDYKKSTRLKKEINNITICIHMLDATAKAFSLKGTVAEHLINMYINSLTNAVSEYAENSDIDIRFIYDTGLKCEFSVHDDEKWRPYELLSSGEQMLALFMVLNLCNKLSGLNLFIMDNMDALDDKNLKDFVTILSEHADEYDNILISGVNHKGTKKILENANIAIA